VETIRHHTWEASSEKDAISGSQGQFQLLDLLGAAVLPEVRIDFHGPAGGQFEQGAVEAKEDARAEL
jgi:hypothetical protein